jgi:BirA family biotin operon repressor/biotin-[acetyl-CoA-carboxylase] ligase
VAGRKIAGILVETKLVGSRVDIAVAGIGINHDWSDAAIPAGLSDTATSIRDQVGGELPAREVLLGEVLLAIERLYPLVLDGDGVGALLDRARACSAVLGRQVAVRMTEGGLVSGVARDLMPDGGLQLEADGHLRVLHVGEIEQLRPAREDSD